MLSYTFVHQVLPFTYKTSEGINKSMAIQVRCQQSMKAGGDKNCISQQTSRRYWVTISIYEMHMEKIKEREFKPLKMELSCFARE